MASSADPVLDATVPTAVDRLACVPAPLLAFEELVRHVARHPPLPAIGALREEHHDGAPVPLKADLLLDVLLAELFLLLRQSSL